MPSEDIGQGAAASRTALDAAIADEFRRRALNERECVRFTMVRHQGLGPSRMSLKPMRLRGATVWQEERFDGRKVFVRNLAAGEEAEAALSAMLGAEGAREYHLTSPSGDLHARITRKGRTLLSRGKPPEGSAPVAVTGHDKAKDLPLGRFDATPLLRVLEVADGTGAIRASMRGKYDQINAFIREMDTLLDESGADAARTFRIVDCGCGRAYLTLSAYCYLVAARGLRAEVVGIDRNRAIIDEATSMAARLDIANDVRFECADLADIPPDGPKPDLVLSLHACDLATDMAIAHGMRTGARHIMAAPCCQHDLQKQIGETGPMRALLRNGILRERFCDILTDAFRAQLLRIAGYKTRVVEFVSHEATSRNIMIRATLGARPRSADAVAEYVAMRDMWGVVPALEKLSGIMQP